MVLVEFMRGRNKSQVSVSFIIITSIGTGHIVIFPAIEIAVRPVVFLYQS